MFGHGFQTLEDNSEVSYPLGEFFAPECARGFSYDDPDLNITWPLEFPSGDKPPLCTIRGPTGDDISVLVGKKHGGGGAVR
jgi:hypothetical protein